MFDTAQISATNAVSIHRMSLLYGSFIALRDITLTVPRGASVVLLGENGAGKSTLLKVLAGLATPTHGSVQVLGGDARDERHRIAIMGHAAMLYDDLTGPENLAYFAQLAGLPSPHAAAVDALNQVGLARETGKTARRVGDYSQGMRQRASLARALLSGPEILLLDEPFSNLDAASSQAMIARLQAWLADRPSGPQSARSLILTTHQVELAAPLAQITVRLSGGALAAVENSIEGVA